MKRIRMTAAVLACGLVMGSIASFYTTSNAGAAVYFCSNKIEKMEKDAAKSYEKGKITQEEFDKLQQEIAYHRELWNC